jgi:hypothetical protein
MTGRERLAHIKICPPQIAERIAQDPNRVSATEAEDLST